jgi:hypothetical protein
MKNNDWEDKFDVRFGLKGYRAESLNWEDSADEIKSFIKQTLSSEQDRLREEVSGMKKVCKSCKKSIDESHMGYDGALTCKTMHITGGTWKEIGYNQALSDVLSLLNKDQK